MQKRLWPFGKLLAQQGQTIGGQQLESREAGAKTGAGMG
jgi:hypothetical protein